MKLFNWIQDFTHQNHDNQISEAAPIAPVLKARLMELGKMSVADVMIPRSVVMALDVDVQLRRVRRLKSSKTMYFPVYKGDLDHILGWISKPKVLELLNEPNEEVSLTQFLRPVAEISDSTTAAELADAFLKSASPFLVVKNAQGATVGIVPLSEFIELVFGFEMDQAPAPQPAPEVLVPLLRSHEI